MLESTLANSFGAKTTPHVFMFNKEFQLVYKGAIVLTLIPFKDEEEVINMANSTKYGLSASIFTENISKGHRVAAAIKSGVVWINTWLLRDLRIPFGGMKQSGVGREGGFKSLQFFTEPKNVCIKI